jgi:hypothetical protein
LDNSVVFFLTRIFGIKWLLIVFAISGCSWGAPENECRGPLKKIGLGEYIYSFKYPDGCIGDLIKECGLKMLQEKNLVPAGCNEISVLSGAKAENGWAHVKFQCITYP